MFRRIPLWKRGNRRKRQAGGTWIEAALVIVPFFALLFGIVDFGTSLFIRSTVQNAVAAGLRYAVTYQTKAGHCMDDSIRLVTQENALGFLGNTTTPNTTAITVNYYSSNNLSTALSGAANQPGNVVEVTATYQWKWLSTLTGVFGAQRSSAPLNITAYSSDRLGGLAPGVVAPCR
jgi:Flp pilus assembly protein TadG